MRGPELSLRPSSLKRPGSCTYKKATNPAKQSLWPPEPFAKFRRQGFYGSGEGTGNPRGTSALCLNGHKRHKGWIRQVSNLIQESVFTDPGSPANRHKRHKNAHRPVSTPILCLLCFLWLSLLHHSAGSGISAGRGEETGPSRDQSALCLNGHKRHQGWNRQVSNLIQESVFTDPGSPANRHKRHKNTHRPVSNPILCLLWLSLLHHSAGSGISAGRDKGTGHAREKAAICCIMGILDFPSEDPNQENPYHGNLAES